MADFGRNLRSSDSLRGIVFKKRKNCSQNLQVLRLQAVIRNDYRSPEIHGQMVPLRDVWFPFTVRINSKYFSWDVRSVQESYLPKLSATFAY